MIGHYVHHVGSGHLVRAQQLARSVAEHLGVGVIGLSSLPHPQAWPGEWIQLPRDDHPTPAGPGTGTAPLHWTPTHHRRLQGRAARTAGWVADTHPAALVVDQSMEVTDLARLLGCPRWG